MSSLRSMANALRFLSIDAVEHAQSGHPGMPMGMADIAAVLWHEFLRHNPSHPYFVNRDRFILSNGHGSMLLYALLHLTGYDVSIDDLKAFRQLHSKTPGHPEYGLTPGVETSTGPLGQGLAHGVGMALAESLLAKTFNRPGFPLIDHHTYVFCGDGCLMEGVSHEAASLAGTWKLGKLIVFWDDNGISIDGPVGPWFSENIPLRFRSYGWHVIENVDGHDEHSIRSAIREAQRSDPPTLLCCKTTIGFGAPHRSGTAQAHGAPLGPEEIAGARKALAWPHAPFEIPPLLRQAWNASSKGHALEEAWQQLFKDYSQEYPELAETFLDRLEHRIPQTVLHDLEALAEKFQKGDASIATRKASQQCIASFAPALPSCLGGSADLTESNLTHCKGMQPLDAEKAGQYIHYGVREFGMSAIMCGLALYGCFIPFGGTFLTFSDYARPAIRLAALMRKQIIWVMTHDSIGLGEDGPTHQPVEHLSALRLIPDLEVWRPCDAVETAHAWAAMLQRTQGPSILALSRQNLPTLKRSEDALSHIGHGGYILHEVSDPECLIIATGSEVSLGLNAALLLRDRYRIRVVSMPCYERFKAQSKDYQHLVIPAHLSKRLVIEAGSSEFWKGLAGSGGMVLGLDHFGFSGKAPEVYQACGLTEERVIACVEALCARAFN